MTSSHDTERISCLDLVEGLRAEHARILADLDRLSRALLRAPRSDFPRARAELEDWLRDELLPHANREQPTYDLVGSMGSGALHRSLEAEHRKLREAAESFAEVWNCRIAGAWARSLYAAFDGVRRKEEELIFPRLLAA